MPNSQTYAGGYTLVGAPDATTITIDSALPLPMTLSDTEDAG